MGMKTSGALSPAQGPGAASVTRAQVHDPTPGAAPAQADSMRA